MGEIVERSAAALESIRGSQRSEIWISLVETEYLRRSAQQVERRIASGERLEMAGVLVAVKDNIDVGGLATTAGCPAYSRRPPRSAPSVAALIDAGALIIGKTNMDQFATGLVGTRSPYGIVRNAVDPRYVSGGSSSGSAVAVALGQVDIALGTDTAGSGRVPAGFNGIVGLKPTRGIITSRGTVPACASLDCVSIFSGSVEMARRAFGVMSGRDPADPYGRDAQQPPRSALQTIGVPSFDALDLSGDDRKLCELALGRLADLGLRLEEVDIAPFLEAGRLLYGGALVAERYAAIGGFVAEHRDQVDPVVAEIIERSAALPAYKLAADLDRLAHLRLSTDQTFRQIDALVLPSAPFHPTINEVEAEPILVNEQIGVFSHFCNPLDLCAVTLPSGPTADGLPWGLTVFAPAFSDQPLIQLGARYLGEQTDEDGRLIPPGGRYDARRLIVVAGAHMRGQPLNSQLTGEGAEFVESTTTAASYRLYRLRTTPSKPGLSWVPEEGKRIEVEIWSLGDRGFASVVSSTQPPLAIGPVQLSDKRWLPGFLAQPDALRGAADITDYGGWRAYLERVGGV